MVRSSLSVRKALSTCFYGNSRINYTSKGRFCMGTRDSQVCINNGIAMLESDAPSDGSVLRFWAASTYE